MKRTQKHIVESYISSYNNFDIDGMIKNLDSQVVFENYTNSVLSHRTNGLDEFKKLAIVGLDYFSSRSQVVMSWDEIENIITVDIKYKGVAKINLTTGINAGEEILLEGKSEFIFHENKITQITDKS